MKLVEIGYTNLYFKSEKDKFNAIYGNKTPEISKIGFQTNAVSRGQILTKLEEVVRLNSVSFYSGRLFDELKTFIWKGNKAQAQKGKNDDLVISAAIATWLFEADPKRNKASVDVNSAMLKAFAVNKNNEPNKNVSPWAKKGFNPFGVYQWPDMPASGSAGGLSYDWLTQ